MQSAAVVDPTANSHWSSQEWLVTGAQSEGLISDWLMSLWWADSGEAWRRMARRLARWALRQRQLVEVTLRQERLVEEVLLAVSVAYSSGGAQGEAMVVQVQA